MSLTAFLSGILALLLAPGPTNALMGLAGVQRGFAGAVRLVPAEILGYLTTILPLAVIGAGGLAQWPDAATAIRAAAATWVMVLALRLWGSRGGDARGPEVTARRIYVTTVLNPKALLFALVFLPMPADPHFAPRLVLLCLTVGLAAAVWARAGHLARGRRAGHPQLMQRLASLWLAAVSLTLAAGLFHS